MLVAVALSGCSAPEPPDPEAVQQWLSRQESASVGVGIGAMSALASKTADTAAEGVDEPEGVRIELAESARISSIEFTCFGAETMDAVVHVTTRSSSAGTGVQVRCADGPVEIANPVDGLPVSMIRANGVNDSGFGAWSVVVR